MSKKTFVLSGLLLIHAYFLTVAASMYLRASKANDYSDLSVAFYLVILLVLFTMLWKRFQTVGRKKRTLVWCAIFWLPSVIIGTYALHLSPYMSIMIFDAGFWHELQTTTRTESGWSTAVKIEFVLPMFPANYVIHWGLFALLWFGAQTPKGRSPSAGRSLTTSAKQTVLNALNIGRLRHG
ncbi:hypothetical protein [Litorimonas cladophorae]|nr:hypothetical protein [Litorimonas cladophorae]